MHEKEPSENDDSKRIGIEIISDKGEIAFDGTHGNKSWKRVLRDNTFVWDPEYPASKGIKKLFEAGYDAPDNSGPLYGFNDPAVLLPITVVDGNDDWMQNVEVMTFVGGRGYSIKPLSTNQPSWQRLPNRAVPDRVGDPAEPGVWTPPLRVFGNMVLLPNGSVMVLGGFDLPWRRVPVKAEDEESYAQNAIEYFNPRSRTWRIDQTSKLSIPRGYHSNAILLYDGRVLVGSGNRYVKETGGQNLNFPFPELELVTPDYYRNGPKPEFSVSRPKASYGASLVLTLEGGWSTSEIETEVSFIRCSSCTHAFGYDQRMVRLSAIDVGKKDSFKLKIPNNRNVMPPGFYMVFVISKRGVPSCAQFVQL
jgi:hypothetical protein